MSANTKTYQPRSTSSRLEQRLAEVFDSLWDDFVDPREAFADEDGQWWLPLDGGGAQRSVCGITSEQQLSELRQECRKLALVNEFAVNGIENRISYIVGPGHGYLATVCKGMHAADDVALGVQKVLDEFVYVNRWHERQQEIVRRMDRDGEAFLRFFSDRHGMTHVRMVEPDQVTTPRSRSGDPSANFGIVNRAGDVESVVGYYVDGELIGAGEVQHRKANVDRNVKRGLPLYTPVRKNLRRAAKLLRNMSILTEIQSAIALIRKHRGAARSGVEQFVAATADGHVQGAGGGRARHYTQYGPGTILDAPAGLEYDFPTTGISAASFVEVLKAELRAIAARLVMPEFMFTSDASSSNYASTMVAEGPAVKMFQRLQAALVEDDREVIRRVIQHAASMGRVAADALEVVEIQIMPPPLYVRDRVKEVQVDRIAYANGILSAQTWSQHLGLDYDQEQKNRAMQGF